MSEPTTEAGRALLGRLYRTPIERESPKYNAEYAIGMRRLTDHILAIEAEARATQPEPAPENTCELCDKITDLQARLHKHHTNPISPLRQP